MRIVLDIHMGLLMSEETLQRLLEHQFKQDPKTYYLLFPMSSLQKEILKDLAKKFPAQRDKFIFVKPIGDYAARPWFSPYEKEFLKIVNSLVKKCGAREMVNVISFGGDKDICYATIAPEAKKAIVEAFKGREVREYHYRPLIHPKPEKPIPSIRWPANRTNRNERKEQQKPKVRRRK